jgi:hypothetical protein
MIGVRFPWGAGNFLFDTVSEARPVSYLTGTTGSFPGDKPAGA